MQWSLGKKFEKLPEILEAYQADYEECIDNQQLAGKTLGQISTENSAWGGYYAERAAELKHLHDYMEMRKEETAGKLYQGIKKGSNVALGEREILHYIKSDPLFIKVHVATLEVKEMLDKFNAAVQTFKNIGYAMNNLTALKVAGLEDTML